MRDYQIITLCGSNRFEDWFKAWNEALTLAGNVVFTLAVYASFKGGDNKWYTDEEKGTLDRVHKRKIEHSDAILVLNAFGYIGDSTMSEIEYAKKAGKGVYFLESWGRGYGIGHGDGYTKSYVERAKKFIQLPYVSPIDTTVRSNNQHQDIWCSGNLLPGAGELRSRIVELVEEFH